MSFAAPDLGAGRRAGGLCEQDSEHLVLGLESEDVVVY